MYEENEFQFLLNYLNNLILCCLKGYCSQGKGCLCHQGFSGVNCELRDISYKNNKIGIAKFPFYEKDLDISKFSPAFETTYKTTETSTLKTEASTTTKVLKHAFESNNDVLMDSKAYQNELMEKLRKQMSTVAQKKIENIKDCKNGGLLIDGLCLCLNKFSGLECEIAPKDTETTTIATTTTTTAARRMKAQKLNLVDESQDLGGRRQLLNNKDFTIITINRRGRQGNAL